MTITYPPEMLPISDDPAEVIVCSNSECCLRTEVDRLRAALRRIDSLNDNPAHYNSEINDVIVRALEPQC